jgi:hypothetical protein
MQCLKAGRYKTYFSSSDSKSLSVHPSHLFKSTGSLSSEIKQPEREDDYSLLSVADVKHGLRHISLLPLCTLLAFISINSHSRLYVVLVVHCIYHITLYEALPFWLQSFYIRHPLSNNLIIEFYNAVAFRRSQRAKACRHQVTVQQPFTASQRTATKISFC